MTSIRAVRMATLARAGRPSIPAVYCNIHGPRAITLAQARNKSSVDKDDLGGPGGQEPVDPTQRARQNANLRNKTIAAMILLGAPLFYVLSKPEQRAEAQAQGAKAVDATRGKIQEVRGR